MLVKACQTIIDNALGETCQQTTAISQLPIAINDFAHTNERTQQLVSVDTRATVPPPRQNTLRPAMFSSPSLTRRGVVRVVGFDTRYVNTFGSGVALATLLSVAHNPSIAHS